MTRKHPSKRSRRMQTLTSALALLASSASRSSTTTALVATPTTTQKRQRSFTQLNFHDDYVSTLQTPPQLGSASVLPSRHHFSRSKHSKAHNKLPSWLTVPRSHEAQENMEALKEAMMNSFFSEKEALKLMFAIEEAAKGDRNKLAGAAEFCLILVGTMEMGLNALVAAAFHYCACVENREGAMAGGRSVLDVWDGTQHPGLSMFGDHAIDIATDAANLKKLEMVMSDILKNKKSIRGYPDTKDADNLRNLLLSSTKDWRALAIRSAASLYRLRGLEKGRKSPRLNSEKVRACREALYVFAPLASRLGMHRLKNELESTAFRILYRRQYEVVSSMTGQVRTASGEFREVGELSDDEELTVAQSMSRILEEVRQELVDLLEKDGVFSMSAEDFSVTARVKEPLSMWKKMMRHGNRSILDVPDAIALRIVLESKKMTGEDEDPELTRARDRALCYHVREICKKRFRPLADNPRYKDYIERPKPNGYQSLHYTASTDFRGDDWKLEIQIRSAEMHQVAEYGLASHWEYKSKGKESPEKMEHAKTPFFSKLDYSSNAYSRQIQEWHWQQTQSTSWDPHPASSEPSILFGDDEGFKMRNDRIRKRTERLAPYLRALNKSKSDMVSETVYCILASSDLDGSRGEMLSLPAGACVLDALRERQRIMAFPESETTMLVYHNGDSAQLTRRLENGDVLSLVSAAETILQ